MVVCRNFVKGGTRWRHRRANCACHLDQCPTREICHRAHANERRGFAVWSGWQQESNRRAKKPIGSREIGGLTRRCPARQAITAMAKPCRSITGD